MFNNQYVRSKIDECEQAKRSILIQSIQTILGEVSEEICMQVYAKSISMHQGHLQGNGQFLEQLVATQLEQMNIPHRAQVTIDSSGIICGFQVKKGRCYHILDFVVGQQIEVGKSITEYTVLSCKTTCRERWTQDDWSFTFAPKRYLLLTLSSEYPPSKRFREDLHRKIITCSPKKRDDRRYPLNFEHLMNELHEFTQLTTDDFRKDGGDGISELFPLVTIGSP